MPRPGLPKLIATDLDGTLVRSDDTVSAYTHEVLDRVRAAGIRIVGATGRGPRLTELTRNDIRGADFLVLAGGGRVRRLDRPGRTRSCCATSGCPGAVLAEVLADAGGAGRAADRHGGGARRARTRRCGATTTRPGATRTRSRRAPRADCLTGDVIKAFARHADHDVDDLLADRAPDRARRTWPRSPRPGSASSRSARRASTRRTGLAVVAEPLGVDPADVLVFGDMPNDLPMFAWAGWGRVAVANAHPAVLAAADEITLSNDDDGVAVYLDRLLSR